MLKENMFAKRHFFFFYQATSVGKIYMPSNYLCGGGFFILFFEVSCLTLCNSGELSVAVRYWSTGWAGSKGNDCGWPGVSSRSLYSR